nr:transposase [Candidatus Nitrosocaldus islandicus]
MLFITITRYIFSMPYRQLEGFTRALNRLIPKLSIDYSWVRKRILKLDLKPYYKLRDSKEPVAIAIDASGIRVHKCIDGLKGCMEGRRYIKIHFAIYRY